MNGPPERLYSRGRGITLATMTRPSLDPSPRLVLPPIRKLAGPKYTGMVEKVGMSDPFLVLVSCVMSLRTKDELTEVRSKALFAEARTPGEMISLGPAKISKLIYPVGFYRRKSEQIVEMSRIIIEEHAGRVPDTIEGLTKLPGVGRKTANLVVSVGYGKPGICVDTHVHRISNRWGWVDTNHPDKTEQALRRTLPKRYWIQINSLLVFFGKTVCMPISPKCSECPVFEHCPRVGVTRSR
jgi:endonuclease-3